MPALERDAPLTNTAHPDKSPIRQANPRVTQPKQTANDKQHFA
jgi:hypothetical protein